VSLAVPVGADGLRADRFVADATGMSRAHVQRLIREGRLTRAGQAIRASVPIATGDALELDVPDVRPVEIEPEQIPLRVVYADDDMMIVEKPAGLVTHPSPGHAGGTLVNALLAMGGPETFGGIAGVARPGIVHRLDRDTSGLLMVARTDRAQASLMAQLKARRVKKTYLALVAGEPPGTVGRIEAPVGRDPRHRTRMAVVPNGRPAVTAYRVRERFDAWSLLEVDLVTGRTHQIRVHLASIGHAVAGDSVYSTGEARRGPAGLARLFLHAWRLELEAPSGGRMIHATSSLPDDLEAVLDALRRRTEGAQA